MVIGKSGSIIGAVVNDLMWRVIVTQSVDRSADDATAVQWRSRERQRSEVGRNHKLGIVASLSAGPSRQRIDLLRPVTWLIPLIAPLVETDTVQGAACGIGWPGSRSIES